MNRPLKKETFKDGKPFKIWRWYDAGCTDIRATRKNMQHIKSSDTKIEVLLRKALWHRGYRYWKNYNALQGKPDIVLTKYKIIVFCDGEFFHGKDWEVLKPRLEKSNNSEFWIAKTATY